MPIALPIQHDVSLRSLNTFGLNAIARAYLRVDNVALLEQAGSSGALCAVPLLVLGGGSNLVLTQDFDGLVLHMVNRGMEVVARGPANIMVRAAAGESWQALVEWTLLHGFGGLENLSLIPGSVGAAPIQNIGAYGMEVGALIDSLRYYDVDTGRLVTLARTACEFGYRDSVFKRGLRGRAVIVDVTFALPIDWRPNLGYAELRHELEQAVAPKRAEEPEQESGRGSTSEPPPESHHVSGSGAAHERRHGAGQSTTAGSAAPSGAVPATVGRHRWSPDARAVSDAVIAIRTRKLPDPTRIGNAGSFFKNPLVSAAQHARLAKHWPELVGFPQPGGGVKLAAGWLIDQCGWKGRSLGAAGVYEKQALVLVNRGGATGTEVMRLAAAIQADVLARFDVMLETEPVVI